MKSKITLFFLATLVMLSCSKDNSIEQETFTETIDRRLEPGDIDDGTNGDPNVIYEDFLLAGQNMDSGTVTVTVEGGNVVVNYSTNQDWVITETHLFVGDINDLPTNGGGNPRIGHFPFSGEHTNGTTDVTYTTLGIEEGDCVYIAAHAVVTNIITGETETAWANGDPIGGNSWAMGFEACY
ncbi:MAG TPA: hypothetical protein DCS66_13935 [Flavobacteriaceae bacterium]|nr:hypothetical protein [Flavobacteriaceae bacterium]HAT65673.1 hypothetical protein [Flavobacteriaceae bacterium]|tara:strand:- start:306 stop:851 length:546 start_codon:yes stop_codon:yes gene_type:complete